MEWDSGPQGHVAMDPFPELTDEQVRFFSEVLRRKGLSTRDVEDVFKELWSEQQLGTSSSSISRHGKEVSEAAFRKLTTQRYDADPIVAVQLDGTAIGRKGHKRTVVIVTGITADGRKRALHVGIAQHERGEDIAAILWDLVDRGVDPRVMFGTDDGAGIKSGIERVTGGDLSRHQLCTTHAVRNVKKLLPKELQEWAAKRMYQGWRHSDGDRALAEQGALADELEAAGHVAAAEKLRSEPMRRTVTVHRLKLSRKLREALRSINMQEGVNSSIKDAIKNNKRWRGDAHILRWVAEKLLDCERNSWSRIPEPSGLVDLMERLMPGRHDPEAIRARIPPTISAGKLAVPFDDAHGNLPKIVANWCEATTASSWEGSAGILRRLGLKPGEAVSAERLLAAMKLLDPETGQPQRVARIEAPTAGPAAEKVPGILALEWELKAAPLTVREWDVAPPARKAEIEAALRRAASAAAAVLSKTTQPTHGFAGASGLLIRPGGEGTEPRLAVRGFVVAVIRGTDEKSKLMSPAPDEKTNAALARAAEDRAKEVLDAELGKSAETAGPATSPPTPELRDGVARLALAKAPGKVELETGTLEAQAATAAERRAELARVGPEVDRWYEANRKPAAWEIVAAREGLSDAERAADPYQPLSPEARLVLGEARTQELLGDAAYLRGVADVEPRAAAAVGAFDGRPLAGLDEPIARADALAEAIAAERELERRWLLESVLTKRRAERAEAGEITLSDRGGRPVVDPVRRNARVLGDSLAEPLRRYGAAIGADLDRLDESQLGAVAAATAEPWQRLDPKAGIGIRSLEADRDTAHRERLRTLRAAGRSAAAASQLEAEGRGGELFEAVRRRDALQERASARWEDLRELGARLAAQRSLAGAPQRLLDALPSAALHQAASSLRLQRARATEAEAGRGAVAERPLEAVGPDLGA